MAFSATSFFGGIGTAFVAIAMGFAGGAMISTSPKLEPNRLERLAANVPVASTKPETSATPSVPAAAPVPVARADAPEAAPAADRVIAMMPPQNSEPSVPLRPQPPVATDDVAARSDNVKKVREDEVRKDRERRAEVRRERRKRQEIQAAANAVRQMQRDGAIEEVSQREETPRFGFFGN
jgi:hypothetical protein